jgi:hypothetical protein
MQEIYSWNIYRTIGIIFMSADFFWCLIEPGQRATAALKDSS